MNVQKSAIIICMGFLFYIYEFKLKGCIVKGKYIKQGNSNYS